MLEPLLAERPDGDAAAAFERASLHDMLGDEHAAIPHYRAAIDAGLYPERQGYAAIQLASTLRNVGRFEEAVALLESLRTDERLGAAARAFLALAIHDLGRRSDALRIVLADHAPNVPLYGRALSEYAALLPQDERAQYPHESTARPAASRSASDPEPAAWARLEKTDSGEPSLQLRAGVSDGLAADGKPLADTRGRHCSRVDVGCLAEAADGVRDDREKSLTTEVDLFEERVHDHRRADVPDR